uniref:Helicase ATP-binding domain-containing protein n=1 Tax=Castor canadensis TaxID=51338 RepID=A0A8C0WJB3_CASCN
MGPGAGPLLATEDNDPSFLQALQAQCRPDVVRAQVDSSSPLSTGRFNWLAQCFHCQNGCILGDEMGLGKTSQTTAPFVYLAGRLNDEGPFLILCPLSVLRNWKEEMEKFAPGFSYVIYAGNKEERAHLQQDLNQVSLFHVLLTTYLLHKTESWHFLHSFSWSVLVVDEVHRLGSLLLFIYLFGFSVVFLVTGTPIENSFHEQFSLLSFVETDHFSKGEVKDFVQHYQDIERYFSGLPTFVPRSCVFFLLRRVEAEVATELPKKIVVIYHGMSALQKKYYQAILMKDLNNQKLSHGFFSLPGVETEPFEVGDHLIEASGKLQFLDKLLDLLYSSGHLVLLFSHMTLMLGILQDYMYYRGDLPLLLSYISLLDFTARQVHEE